MYYCDSRLQYPVRVERPNPVFAKMLQQAIGGVEGEIRVCLQYFFQAWGQRGPKKYREMLLQTATEEIGHIEMLATAVALNLEGAPVTLKDEMAKDGAVAAVLGGMNPRHFLPAGLAATPENSNGVPFNCSHVYASGNIAGDMLANATAEATGRTLACRLYEMTDDPGMKDMLAFLIARDTMHQQQWLAVIEELGGYKEQLPVPNSFPQSKENQEFSYVFMNSNVDGSINVNGRFTEGPSLDGKGTYTVMQNKPMGQEPVLASGPKEAHAQNEQMAGILGRVKAAVLSS
ncbi:MAG: manganese catalase family protein [Acidobacteriaceae bacterium]|nr:manganese catalase family protein [Acidobacteriaceae bacterium]